jgi:hypothetical protein
VSGHHGTDVIGAAGAGLIGAAVFPTDPVSGYPPGTPDALTRPTRTGIAHNLAAVPVFAGLPAAALASGWRSRRAGQHRFGLYSAGTAVTMLTTMALAGAGFGQSPRLINLGGLFQRASIITGFAWLTALSAQALRPPRSWQAEQEIRGRGTAGASGSQRPDWALVGFLVRRAAMVRSGMPVVVWACPRNAVASSWPELSAGRPGKADQRPTR